MPKRKICPHCGFINRPESDECDICGYDLSLIKQVDVPKGLKEHFFDSSTNSYVAERPNNKTDKTDEISITEDVQISEEQEHLLVSDPNENNLNEKGKLVKICPACHTENDKDAVSCKKCGVFLMFERPTVAIDKKDIEKESEEDFVIDDIGFESESNKKPSYFLYIGKSGENCVEIKFDSHNNFSIGRHFQPCLENSQYVSSYHCRIKNKDGKFYLYEPADRPSSNGTYLRTIGDRKERIKPGHAYLIKNGSVFYIADVPCTFAKGL